ncbi:metallophosphoesterase family protein [Streptomyces sp. NPDC088354]|uniref:metallophosphoesterase family protein n=1 Tax=unclassified Streptomyces TaxID=2593676 RepID=UPI0029A6B077|nr:metallophosphoesterase family protein [Streptomyces sp. MI02-7b]MDX3073167.1 metallophosphoesterase family protein [Streptomyces sp. MI02-7b]
MLQRVAVLADIHGNLPALEAVLAEPDVRDADRVVLAGDHAAGPLPGPTLERLRALGDRAVWIGGNADRELVEHRRDGRASGYEVSDWAAAELTDDHVSWLARLPLTAELEVAEAGRTVFCHATVRDDEEIVLVDSRAARWAEVMAGLGPDVETVVCGHTHMPYVRLAFGRLVVNPGSVGMPYGRPGAHWALLGAGGVRLRRTVYDREAAAARIAGESGFAGAARWAEEYVLGTYSAEEVVAAWGPRDGRPE